MFCEHRSGKFLLSLNALSQEKMYIERNSIWGGGSPRRLTSVRRLLCRYVPVTLRTTESCTYLFNFDEFRVRYIGLYYSTSAYFILSKTILYDAECSTFIELCM